MHNTNSSDRQESATEYVVECDGERHITEDRAEAVRVANEWLAESRGEAQYHGEWLESVETLAVYERRAILRAQPRDSGADGRAFTDYTLAQVSS